MTRRTKRTELARATSSATRRKASIPTRHTGSFWKNARTARRFNWRRMSTWPAASTPWTWKIDFAMSRPIVVTACMSVDAEAQALADATISHFTSQLGAVDKAIALTIDNDCDLQSKRDLLLSISGVGETLAGVVWPNCLVQMYCARAPRWSLMRD